MDNKVRDFPQYRKLSNEKSFYCIESERSMVEIQLIGSKVYVHRIQADKYPEVLRIADILNNEGGQYVESSESEFNRYLEIT